MEALKMSEREASEKIGRKRSASLYQAVWRWHFYAGLIFSPFLIILAFSGGVYLFKPQIENVMYQDLYFVEEGGAALAASAQTAGVLESYPDASVTSVRFYDDPARSTEVGIMQNGEAASVYVNPYNGSVLGDIPSGERFTDIFVSIHSELLIGGTAANLLVELAACWAVILLITGLYIWWPRKRSAIWGTVLPRLRSKGRTFWRDLHAVPAFWLSLGILVLILTGLPWSGVMGEQINRLATSTNTGYPAFAQSFGEKPESQVLAKDVASDVPWASENMPVPSSVDNGYVPISVDDAVTVASQQNIAKPYTISMPQGEAGVYTLATSHANPSDSATIHLDQYTGSILSDVRFQDYGIMAQGITLGIALHEGRLFGLANQILGLIVCIGLIFVIISSFVMWKKRKPKGRSGAPAKPKDKKVTRIVFFIMLALGVLMPLVGISIIVIYLLDRFVIPRIKPLQKKLFEGGGANE